MVEADGADLFVGQNDVVPTPVRAAFGVPTVSRIEHTGLLEAQQPACAFPNAVCFRYNWAHLGKSASGFPSFHSAKEQL